MIEFLFNPAFSPFVVALVALLGFLIIEVIGLGISSFVDDFFHIDHSDHDIGEAGDFSVLGFFGFGKVPFMILFSVYASFFAAFGFLFQSVFHSLTETYSDILFSSVIAFIGSLFFGRFVSGYLGKTIKLSEDFAASKDDFLKMIAVVTEGEATIGNPAEAKLTDHRGSVHYIRVEPFNDTETFKPDDQVVIVEREENVFKAVKL